MRRALWLLWLAACNGDDPQYLDRAAMLDPASCESCHPRHYREWAGSMHAYAAEDPVFLAMNARGQEETDGALGDFCVNCHAPMAVREGATFDGLNLADVPAELKGVTCYFCHSVDAVEGSHNNPLRLASDLVMRGAIRNPVENTAHAARYSPLHDRDQPESATLCGSCHDIVTPDGVHLERTFEEWQTSLFGNGQSGGLTCGNCHMNGDEDTAANFEGVPLREVHDHRMPGVDVALTPFPHREEALEQVKAELDGVVLAQMCIEPPLAATNVTVTLENAFAGHNIPSGAAQDRRMWLELTAWDAGDNVIFETGKVSADQPIASLAGVDPNLWLFRDRIFDAQGAEVHMFWEAASVESELLPQAMTNDPMEVHARTRTFTIDLAAGIPQRVEMRLLMRPMGLEVLRDLVDSGHLDAAIPEQMPTFEVVDAIRYDRAVDGNAACVPPDVF